MRAFIEHDGGTQELISDEATEYNLEAIKSNDYITLVEGTRDDILRFSYFSQSALQVALNLGTDPQAIDWTQYMSETNTFRCRDITQNIEKQSVDSIQEQTNAKVQMQNPESTIGSLDFDGTRHIIIDCVRHSMHKREYKMFINPAALRSTIAYCALIAAQFKPGMTLLDPFCGGGTIPIEAAIFSEGIGPHHFRKEQFSFIYWPSLDASTIDKITTPNKPGQSVIKGFDWNITAVKAAQKNASIANVQVDFTRYEVEFMAHKFEDNSVDAIVTHPPEFNKKDKGNKLQRHLAELFSNAELVLKKKRRLVVVTNSAAQLLEIPHNLRHIKTYPVSSGQKTLDIVVIDKS